MATFEKLWSATGRLGGPVREDRAAGRARLSRVSWKLRWRSPARTGREVGVGRPPRHHRQGTAVTKNYQNDKIDTPAADGFVVPERVSVAMAEIAGSMREAG